MNFLDHDSPQGSRRRTGIVCTIGPACRAPKKLLGMVQAGMDVARLHFSYADQAEHAVNIKRIRQVAEVSEQKISILQDLSGTKARLLNIQGDGVELRPDAEFCLTADSTVGDASRASVNLPALISIIAPGDIILLADGRLKLEALTVSETEAHCKVLVGGRIKTRQAIHISGKSVPESVPTAKDREDVAFGVRHQVDWIAQSFVTSAREIHELRTFIKSLGASTPIVAKIERREALDHLEEIVAAADAIMVARGDLGLELPLEQIAFIQKYIIRCANTAGKPVITATEMLTSMMRQPHPTRAEVTDVTNAILDGSDSVMLSGETGVGKFPVEAVAALSRIATVADDFRKQLETNVARELSGSPTRR